MENRGISRYGASSGDNALTFPAGSPPPPIHEQAIPLSVITPTNHKGGHYTARLADQAMSICVAGQVR